MNIARRTLLGTATAATALPAGRRARAQANTIKIGIMNDQSGQYRDNGGITSVLCAKQAVEEFQSKGFNVEVISADHQNKPDLGVGLARQWCDVDKVDMILDVPTSSVALAVASVSKDKGVAYVNIGAATSDLTGKACLPTMISYCYDTWMLAKSTGGATVKAGGDSWYFITADYAFGQQLQKDTTALLLASGGKVMGASPYPFPGTTDFSSFLVQAQASGAKILGLCNAGGDTVNTIKQAREFGIKMKLAAMLMLIGDVHALGLDVAQGLVMTESFYWDLNDRTRAFAKRFLPKSPKNYPNMIHAGNYSATLHFLKAVADLGVAEAKKSGLGIIDRMKKMPVDDDCFQGSIRQDGRGIFPVYLLEVKKPAESKGPWDYFKVAVTTPAAEAWRPLKDGGCSFITA